MSERSRATPQNNGSAASRSSEDIFAARAEAGLLGDRYYRALTDWTVGSKQRDAALACYELGRAYLESLDKLLEMLDRHDKCDETENIVMRTHESKALIERDLKSIEDHLR